MDWSLYMSGFFALGGALLGGLVTIFVQFWAQRKEDARHTRRLALIAATTEWTKHFELLRDVEKTTGTEKLYRPFSDYLIVHLSLMGGLVERDLMGTDPCNIAAFLMDMDKKQDELFEKYKRPKCYL